MWRSMHEELQFIEAEDRSLVSLHAQLLMIGDFFFLVGHVVRLAAYVDFNLKFTPKIKTQKS